MTMLGVIGQLQLLIASQTGFQKIEALRVLTFVLQWTWVPHGSGEGEKEKEERGIGFCKADYSLKDKEQE